MGPFFLITLFVCSGLSGSLHLVQPLLPGPESVYEEHCVQDRGHVQFTTPVQRNRQGVHCDPHRPVLDRSCHQEELSDNAQGQHQAIDPRRISVRELVQEESVCACHQHCTTEHDDHLLGTCPVDRRYRHLTLSVHQILALCGPEDPASQARPDEEPLQGDISIQLYVPEQRTEQDAGDDASPPGMHAVPTGQVDTDDGHQVRSSFERGPHIQSSFLGSVHCTLHCTRAIVHRSTAVVHGFFEFFVCGTRTEVVNTQNTCRPKMKIYDLLEARKNPSKNPKTSVNDLLQSYYDENGEDTFVSFTSVDKLGINPQSKYDTPLGIYAYPLSYVLREIGEVDSPGAVLPFAGDSQFVNVFTASSQTVLHIDEITTSTYEMYLTKLKQVLPTSVELIDAASKKAPHDALHSTPGGLLWYVTRDLATKLAKGTSTKPPVMWNKIFRSIGINGVVDSQGDGIIHHNEPTQAVFFRRDGVVKNERRFANKYSPDIIERRRDVGNLRKKAGATLAMIRKEHLSGPTKDFIGFCRALRKAGLYTQDYLPQDVLTELPIRDAILGLYDEDIKVDKGNMIFVSHVLPNIRGKRWPACEKYLCSKALVNVAVDYAINNLEGAFPEAEKIILANASIPRLYSYVADGRKSVWPEAEAKFAEDPADATYLKAYRKKFKIGTEK